MYKYYKMIELNDENKRFVIQREKDGNAEFLNSYFSYENGDAFYCGRQWIAGSYNNKYDVNIEMTKEEINETEVNLIMALFLGNAD